MRSKTGAKERPDEEGQMIRFGLRCLALVVIPLTLALGLGCEDEKKNVCCDCYCYNVINPTTQDIEEETIHAKGKNLNCDAECRAQCSQLNWDIDRAVKVPCPANGK
jgi:hypothetical protein